MLVMIYSMPIGNNGCNIWQGYQRRVARKHILSSWPPLHIKRHVIDIQKYLHNDECNDRFKNE